MTAARLVFGWGNRSRGDDAIGPLCIVRLREALGDDAGVECLDDYQLQVEHALDLVGRRAVLFVDACRGGTPPFVAQEVHAARDASFTSHALSPQALLQVYEDLRGEPAPPATLLGICGEQFELGAEPGRAALAHLEAALPWIHSWLGR
ncbi:MAG: hydrogenase maturation protease [Burkholderiales bacterium]|nr:hydrogenase maturation protease [Burkholderiales bacterium]MDE2456453.1 hydrogenase maturation protease [Burkholderiales bacterium]